MAYVPTEWETGDVITAAKLNKIEQGIEDAAAPPSGDVFVVNFTPGDTWTADKTFAEIDAAITAGKTVLGNASSALLCATKADSHTITFAGMIVNRTTPTLISILITYTDQSTPITASIDNYTLTPAQ